MPAAEPAAAVEDPASATAFETEEPLAAAAEAGWLPYGPDELVDVVPVVIIADRAFRSKRTFQESPMKAFIVDRYKGKLRLGDMPDPELRNHDVLVQIYAAGVNPLDSKIRDGELKLILPYRLPLILGNELAGVVIRVGSKVRGFKPGDEVYARPNQDRIGTFAEFIAMNEADVALKPKNLTMEEAASIPLVALAAWQVLIDRANLKKGEKVLIHAGSGGFGTLAIQLAKHIGATVATTTSAANVDLVKSLGADVVVDYRQEDFEKVLSGYDVVVNSLGKDTLEKSLNVLKPGGKLISISGPPDAAFAKESGLNWFVQQAMRLLSFGIRRTGKWAGAGNFFDPCREYQGKIRDLKWLKFPLFTARAR
jgi:NADPH:quinone reductase-like Zn-dependent oxidoreductase